MPIHYESKKIYQKDSRKILKNQIFLKIYTWNAPKMLWELLYDIIMSDSAQSSLLNLKINQLLQAHDEKFGDAICHLSSVMANGLNGIKVTWMFTNRNTKWEYKQVHGI